VRLPEWARVTKLLGMLEHELPLQDYWNALGHSVPAHAVPTLTLGAAVTYKTRRGQRRYGAWGGTDGSCAIVIDAGTSEAITISAKHVMTEHGRRLPAGVVEAARTVGLPARY